MAASICTSGVCIYVCTYVRVYQSMHFLYYVHCITCTYVHTQVRAPFAVESIIERHSHSRVEYLVKVRVSGSQSVPLLSPPLSSSIAQSLVLHVYSVFTSPLSL